MKKIIIITLIAFALIGCSNDDAPATKTSCNCVKLIQQRVITVTVTATGQTSTTTPWALTGAGQVASDVKDCASDGKVVYTNSFSSGNRIQEFRHILSCK
jgi:uncharacterized lipoprotein NlpE involved in copper resistance